MLNSKNEKEKNETEKNIRIKHKSINFHFYRNLWGTECVYQDSATIVELMLKQKWKWNFFLQKESSIIAGGVPVVVQLIELL